MASLFSVPPRPTSNSHDLKALRELSEWLKSERKTLNILCDGMGCSKRVAKVCARCKAASYCSVKCQMSHWREHRSDCQPRPVCMKRFILTLLRHRILVHIITAIFIVHFKLDERTQVGPSSEPIYIGASIGMLPYGWASSDDLYNTTPARPRPIAVSPSGTDSSGRRRRAGVEVFLQITGLSYLTETNPTGAYHREHQRAWEQAIPSDPALPECQVQFIGLLFVDYGEQWDKRNLLRLSISKKEIDAFRNGTFFSDHAHAEAVLGERMPHPLTPESLVQYINRHIEADIENFFRLRTFLKPDKATLVAWGRDVLQLLTKRKDLEREEVIQCLRVYNPDGSKLNLCSA